MHHPTDRITHTTAFVTPVVEHWLVREIAQWGDANNKGKYMNTVHGDANDKGKYINTIWVDII